MYFQLPPYEVTLNSDVESQLTLVLEQLAITPIEPQVGGFCLCVETFALHAENINWFLW